MMTKIVMTTATAATEAITGTTNLLLFFSSLGLHVPGEQVGGLRLYIKHTLVLNTKEGNGSMIII